MVTRSPFAQPRALPLFHWARYVSTARISKNAAVPGGGSDATRCAPSRREDPQAGRLPSRHPRRTAGRGGAGDGCRRSGAEAAGSRTERGPRCRNLQAPCPRRAAEANPHAVHRSGSTTPSDRRAYGRPRRGVRLGGSGGTRPVRRRRGAAFPSAPDEPGASDSAPALLLRGVRAALDPWWWGARLPARAGRRKARPRVGIVPAALDDRFPDASSKRARFPCARVARSDTVNKPR
jgi:hypothetical protein